MRAKFQKHGNAGLTPEESVRFIMQFVTHLPSTPVLEQQLRLDLEVLYQQVAPRVPPSRSLAATYDSRQPYYSPLLRAAP